LYFIFKLSYKTGLETSLRESKYKYKVASWLQEMPEIILVLETNLILISAFKKNDHLVSDYLNYREKHFNVIKRQFTQLIILDHHYRQFTFYWWFLYTTNEY
jgi:hypothetical protein